MEIVMGDANSSDNNKIEPNAKNLYEITDGDLPLHCPMDGMSLWDSHPRVYIPMETGKGKCPYCGADFVLKE